MSNIETVKVPLIIISGICWTIVYIDGFRDPSRGSRHNRGSAVDLTLYHLKTGKPVEMVATYDETTDRAHSDYPGGTSLQRWHRELLRKAMEAEGFTVYAPEWWHFDYKDWQKYRMGNLRFDQIQTN